MDSLVARDGADAHAKFHILIVDDEPLARERVRAFLRTEPNVKITGECGDGLEALEAIRRKHPDIVLLDVQMPGCSGLQVLAELPEHGRPAIILATAHDRFAADAAAGHVTDFLLKPFDRERFQLALRRAIEQVTATRAASDSWSKLQGL
jgi:two-component system LytT family response regulator